MKKLTIAIICLLALSFAAIPVGAQTRARCNNTGYERRFDQRSNNRCDSRNNRNQDYRTDAYSNSGYRNDVYDNSGYRNNDYQNGSVWDRHRDKITTAGGAVAGALLGSLAGGKRGAIIGAIAGGGGAALYTYKIRNKDRY